MKVYIPTLTISRWSDKEARINRDGPRLGDAYLSKEKAQESILKKIDEEAHFPAHREIYTYFTRLDRENRYILTWAKDSKVLFSEYGYEIRYEIIERNLKEVFKRRKSKWKRKLK